MTDNEPKKKKSTGLVALGHGLKGAPRIGSAYENIAFPSRSLKLFTDRANAPIKNIEKALKSINSVQNIWPKLTYNTAKLYEAINKYQDRQDNIFVTSKLKELSENLENIKISSDSLENVRQLLKGVRYAKKNTLDVLAIGKKIKEERKRQKITQEELADLAGVGTRFVRELEQGKETCQIGLAIKVIDTLGLSLEIFRRGELIS